MKKFIIYALRTIGTLILLFGTVYFISGIPKNHEDVQIAGLITAFAGVLYFAISYVVEAACLYIDKNKKQ